MTIATGDRTICLGLFAVQTWVSLFLILKEIHGWYNQHVVNRKAFKHLVFLRRQIRTARRQCILQMKGLPRDVLEGMVTAFLYTECEMEAELRKLEKPAEKEIRQIGRIRSRISSWSEPEETEMFREGRKAGVACCEFILKIFQEMLDEEKQP